MSTATTEKAGTGGTGNSLVAVNFKGSIKKYYYWVSDKWQVAVGDEITVVTPSSGETVVRVAELLPPWDSECGVNHKRSLSFYRRSMKAEPEVIEEFIPDASAPFDAFQRDAGRSIHQHYDDAMRQAMMTHPVFVTDSSRNFSNLPRTPTKETTMNITNETFIDGNNVKNLTDDQLFQKIAAAEAQIAVLKKIENKPEKLTQKIVQMGLDIQQLVKLIDAR